jgi:hypothetical protein
MESDFYKSRENDGFNNKPKTNVINILIVKYYQGNRLQRFIVISVGMLMDAHAIFMSRVVIMHL